MANMFGIWDRDGDALDDFYGQMSAPWSALPNETTMLAQNDDDQFGTQWTTGHFDTSIGYNEQPSADTHIGAPPAFAPTTIAHSYYDNPSSERYLNNHHTVSPDTPANHNTDNDDYLPGNLTVDDDENYESYVEQPDKKRKINKNGKSRKVRQPRGHLCRWDELDVARALMGIVWACGENGVQIPFDQAARLVNQTCTASALQQAILKLSFKLNKDGAQIPHIKMSWPKKRDAVIAGTAVRDNGKVPRKKPTLTQSTQCNITSLRGVPGKGLLLDDELKDAPLGNGIVPRLQNVTGAQVQHAQLSFRPSTQADTFWDLQFRPASTTSSRQAHYPQMVTGVESQSGQGFGSDSAGIKHVANDELMHVPVQSPALAPSTPSQPHHSPVCPAPPRRSMGTRRIKDVRALLNDTPPSPSGFAQQRSFSYAKQSRADPTNPRSERTQQGRSRNTQLGSLAYFNADIDQRNTQGIGQQIPLTFASSNRHQQQRDLQSFMNPDSVMSRAPNFSSNADDVSTPSSADGGFSANNTYRAFGVYNGLQPPFFRDSLSGASAFDSTIDNDSMFMDGASAAHGTSSGSDRKDSVVNTGGTQSTNSSQGSHHGQITGMDVDSTDSIEQSARTAQKNSHARLAAVLGNRTMTTTPTQVIQPLHQRQQSHQHFSLGLQTLDNPFGGTFGDATSPMDFSGSDSGDIFGSSTKFDLNTGFADQ